MLDEMTPAQFAEWIAFDHVEGIGLWRLVQAASRIGSCVSHGTLTPEFFTELIPPEQKPDSEPQDTVSPGTMAAMFRALTPNG